MPAVYEIKTRIDGIKGIHNITYAMQIVTISRLKRINAQLTKTRDTLEQVRGILGYLCSENKKLASKILFPPINNNLEPLFVLVFSNRGFCGSFNPDVLKASIEKIESMGYDFNTVPKLCVGKRGADILKKHDQTSINYIAPEKDTFFPEDLSVLWSTIESAIKEGRRVYQIYFHFKSIISQTLTCEQLFPATPSELQLTDEIALQTPHFLEPSQSEVEKKMLEYFYLLKTFHAVRSSSSSEFGQRFMLMKSAVDNTKTLTEELVLELNKERQRQITQEIAEIISTFKALQK